MKNFTKIAKLHGGDQVAIISPSAGSPGLFPWVQDLGLERLRSIYQLEPKEYPTTRQMGSSLQDRARDIMAAFSDSANKAIIASIGGEDQIKLLKLLDPSVLRANPKPFFGYSDNTHLVNYLWNLGIPTYYGGAIMTQFAMQGSMHELTIEFLKHALFDRGEFEIRSSENFNDEGLDWSDQTNLTKSRKMEANDRWFWDGSKDAEGILWGGCVESLVAQFAVGTYLPRDDDLDGTVLYLETAEDIPEAWILEYVLTGIGERGWLDKFQAVLVGRPKAWDFNKRNTPEQKAAYRKEQRETVLRTVREYNQTIPIIQHLDFGHTDPQIIVPSGNKARLQSKERQIFFTY